MGKLPALVANLAKSDGRQAAAIDNVARILRAHGLIATGKRGVGGPDMKPADAANLLIALNGCDLSVEGPDAVKRFRSLRRDDLAEIHGKTATGDLASKKLREYLKSPNVPPLFAKAMLAGTFGEALEHLIVATPQILMILRDYQERENKHGTGKAQKGLRGMSVDSVIDAVESATYASMYGVDVVLCRDRVAYSATIEVYRTVNGTRFVDCGVSFSFDVYLAASGFYGSSKRRITIAIGADVLAAAWLAIAPPESNQ